MNIIWSPENLGIEPIWHLLQLSQQAAQCPTGALWGRREVQAELTEGRFLGGLIGSELGAMIFFREPVEPIEITWLASHPQHRKKGYMRTLMRALKAQFSQRVLQLEVHHKNRPAIEFYQSEGFRQDGLRKNYYSDGSDARLFSYKPLQ